LLIRWSWSISLAARQDWLLHLRLYRSPGLNPGITQAALVCLRERNAGAGIRVNEETHHLYIKAGDEKWEEKLQLALEKLRPTALLFWAHEVVSFLGVLCMQ
jgi:hypothetical protein